MSCERAMGRDKEMPVSARAIWMLGWSVAVALLVATQPVAASAAKIELAPLAPGADASPPLPPVETYPLQLVLDDDGAEGSVGVSEGQFAKQFLWVQRFAPTGPMVLEEIWVLYARGPAVGDTVELAVYEDADSDPTNGAALVATFTGTVQAADGQTFSIYPTGELHLDGTGDIWIGVVPRFITSGTTPPLSPAAIDTTASQGRSWIGVWSGDPPSPPVLSPVPDAVWSPIDGFVPGNWMVRGFGRRASLVEVPALGWIGLLAFGLLVAAFALHRLRRSAVTLLILLALLAVAPARATVIDSFTTNQASITDPPGGASTVATGGADILGQHRGLAADLRSGAGPVSVGVAAGALSFSVANTTPDSRGEAVVTWDGDTNPNVLSPTGLGGVDLTASGAASFRLLVNSAGAGSELVLAVYTDGTNASRAALRLPAVAAPTPFYLSFASDFVSFAGTGADFTDVGAIVLTVRGTETSVALDEVTTVSPSVAATKQDRTLADVPITGSVSQGTTFKYRVVVTNTGGQAKTVALADVVDPNVTLGAATVDATPALVGDAYETYGNVAKTVAAPGLLGNDVDPDQNGVPPALTVDVSGSPVATALGGSAALSPDGSFVYTPPIGVGRSVDTFDYTAIDNEGNAATAKATILIGPRLWIVDNTNTPPGTGTFADPFASLPLADAAAGAEDIVYVRTGSGSYDTGGAAGFTMDEGMQLLGEGVALILDGVTLVPAGTAPTITNNDGTPGAGVTLASTGSGTGTLRGMTIGSTGGAKIAGNAFGTLAADTVTLNGNGQALNLANGSLAATLASLATTSSAGQGIVLQQVAGSLTIGGTTVTTPATQGILVTQSTANVSFGNTSVTGGTDGVSLQNNSAGTRTFGTLGVSGGTGVGFLHAVGGGAATVTGATTITNPGGIGISIDAANAALSFAATTVNKGASAGTGVHLNGNGANTIGFASLAITTSSGTGLFAASGGTLSIGGSGNTIAATGGPAVDVTSTSLGTGATFSTVSSTGSAGKGINLDTVTGSFVGNGGSVSGSTGNCFDVNGGSGTITYSGSLTCTTGRVVEVTGRSGGTVTLSGNLSATGSGTGINLASNTSGTINLSGGTKSLSTSTGTAINLATNGTTAINLTGGGLAITTTSGVGFNATGGAGGITVQGSGNTITSTTGTALNVANTTIGGGNLSFLSISANGAPNGIALVNTGSTGGLTVTGDGGGSNNGSGGTIQNSTAEGILLNNTDNVSLGYMNVVNSGTDSIRILDLNGFTLNRSNLDDSAGTTADKAVDIGDFVTGTPVNGTVTFSNDVIGPAAGNSPHDSIAVGISSGTSTWSITGTTIRRTGNSGINWESRGSSTAAVSVSGCTFAGANVAGGSGSPSARGIFVNNLDDSVITLFSITSSSFTNNNIHIDLNQQNDTDPVGSSTFEVLNNSTMTGARSHAINIFAATGGGGAFTGKVQGNTIGNSGVPSSGSEIGNGIRVNINGGSDATVALSNNVVRQTPNGRGMEIIARNGTGGLDVTVTNNDVNPQATVAPLAAILVQSNALTVANTIRSDVHGNTVPAGATSTDLIPQYLALVQSSTSTFQMVDTTAPVSGTCASELAATNTGSTGVLGTCTLIAGPISTP